MRQPAIGLCVFALASLGSLTFAQDSTTQGESHANPAPRAEAQPKANSSTVPIKLQVVFTEFEGGKKLKSLPYTLYHNTARGGELQPDFTKLRISSRVAISTGSLTAWQYFEIATKVDCRAVRNDDGRFLVQLSTERSWVDESVSPPEITNNSEKRALPANAASQPIVRSIVADLYLAMRDGQTVETLAATDPTSGRAIHVDVTLNVLK